MAAALRPARRLARRSLRKAQFFSEAAQRRDLLQRHPDYSLVWMPNGPWLAADTRSRLSMREVMSANLQLVAPVLRREKVPFFVVPNVSENRHRLGVLERFSDRVFDAVVSTYQGQPVYFDLSTETGWLRHVLADDLADVLRVAGRILLVRVYRAYAWPNNAFAADNLHGAEVEFWSESSTGWSGPSGNRVADELPLDATRRTSVQVDGEVYPTLEAFADTSHAALLNFPVDLVFPAPAASASAARPGLRRALRSLWMHTEGFRFVHVVVEGAAPDWLNESHARLKLVHSSDLPDSGTTDRRLSAGGIEGLSDRFVLMADTIMVRRPFRPSDCFTSNGLGRIWIHPSLLRPQSPRGAQRVEPSRSGESTLAMATGGEVLDEAVDAPLCMDTEAIRQLRGLAAEPESSGMSLDPFDVQYFMYSSGRSVTAEARHEVVDASRESVETIARAGQAVSLSTLRGEESPAAQRLLDQWYPEASPFERGGRA